MLVSDHVLPVGQYLPQHVLGLAVPALEADCACEVVPGGQGGGMVVAVHALPVAQDLPVKFLRLGCGPAEPASRRPGS